MSETNKSIRDGPESTMEISLLEEYLRSRGYSFKQLCDLPEEEAKSLMIEACQYASLKLAQVESTARFRDKIREPS